MVSVLIVDDEYLVREGLKTTIEWDRLGFHIVGDADDGTSGLDLAIKYEPDIIITDIRMPFMDGIELMQALRGRHIESKIIVLSGYDDFAYAKSAIECGASAYILKPIENAILVKELTHLAVVIERERTANRLLKEKLVSDLLRLLKTIRLMKTPPYSREVEAATEYIQAHYHEDVTVEVIAEHIHMSQYHLMRIFKQYKGVTIHDYITETRIKKAAELLRNHRLKIYEVSEQVGYQDPKYFSQLFKKMTGLTPKAYAKQSLYE